MKERFDNRDVLEAALLAQRIVQGNRQLASELADAGELIECPPGHHLIEQGATDRDVYFLLSGKVRVIIHGVRHHLRESGVTVGEMTALNPALRRSATLCAEDVCVALKVDGDRFVALLNQHPHAWPLIASDLAARVEQRNEYVNPSNRRPRVFIISSLEAIEVAQEIQLGLQHEDMVTVCWSDNEIFPAGSYSLEALEEQVRLADFGIAIASPDDLVRARDRVQGAPRDNVIFELGFFVSRLGRLRTLLLVPRGEEVKLPSDYKGITPIAYSNPADDRPLALALAPAVTQIKQAIRKLGVRASFQLVQ